MKAINIKNCLECPLSSPEEKHKQYCDLVDGYVNNDDVCPDYLVTDRDDILFRVLHWYDGTEDER